MKLSFASQHLQPGWRGAWRPWVSASFIFSLPRSPWREPDIFRELAVPSFLPPTPSQDISMVVAAGERVSELKCTDTSGNHQCWCSLSHWVLCEGSSLPGSCVPKHWTSPRLTYIKLPASTLWVPNKHVTSATTWGFPKMHRLSDKTPMPPRSYSQRKATLENQSPGQRALKPVGNRQTSPSPLLPTSSALGCPRQPAASA